MNEVQKRLVSEPIEVEGHGTFTFRALTVYEEVKVLRRQAQIAGMDPAEASVAVGNFAYMLAYLELAIATAPEGFDLAGSTDPFAVQPIYNAAMEWRRTFRNGVREPAGQVGKKGRKAERVQLPDAVPPAADKS